MERLPRIWIAVFGLGAAGVALTLNSQPVQHQREASVVVPNGTIACENGQAKPLPTPEGRDGSPRSLALDTVGNAKPLIDGDAVNLLPADLAAKDAEADSSLSSILEEAAADGDRQRPELAAARDASRIAMPTEDLEGPPLAGNNPSERPAAIPAPAGTIQNQTFEPRRLAPASQKVVFNGPLLAPIESEAMVQIRRGLKLGDRQAFFAARTEFVGALRTLTRAFDAQTGKASADEGAYGKSLAAGLRALEELDDLMPRGAEVDADIDLVGIVETHRTPVLKGIGTINSISAVRGYLDYAVSQLARAGGSSRTASHALYGLGRAHMALRNEATPEARMHASKAMVCQQAALRIAPDNYLASNELGVLYAEFGQYDLAKASLLRSVSISSQPTAWQNLAAIHAGLGERDLARMAITERDIARDEQGFKGTGHALEDKLIWVSPDQFAGAISRAPATAKQNQRAPVRR